MDPNDEPMVLLVDDSPEHLLKLEHSLAGLGARLCATRSAAEALRHLNERTPALVLLDVQMPQTDGFALAAALRETERGRHVPLIFVTGDGDAQHDPRAYEQGAVDVLAKPVDVTILRRKVAVFLALHQRRLQLEAQRRAQAEAARVDADMIVALAHLMRTQLAAIALNAELLARRGAGLDPTYVASRIKASAALLARQVDHLAQLSVPPDASLPLRRAGADLAQLVQAGLDLTAPTAVTVEVLGDVTGDFDPTLVTAIARDLRTLVSRVLPGDPLAVQIDGQSSRAVALRYRLPSMLPDGLREDLTSSGLPCGPGDAGGPAPGLVLLQRLARRHGGSLCGRSSARDGTMFELLLPRARSLPPERRPADTLRERPQSTLACP